MWLTMSWRSRSTWKRGQRSWVKPPGTSWQTENICTRNSKWKAGKSSMVRVHVIHSTPSNFVKGYHRSRVGSRLSNGTTGLLPAQLADGIYESCASMLCVYCNKDDAKEIVATIENVHSKRSVRQRKRHQEPVQFLLAAYMYHNHNIANIGPKRCKALAAA